MPTSERTAAISATPISRYVRRPKVSGDDGHVDIDIDIDIDIEPIMQPGAEGAGGGFGV